MVGGSDPGMLGGSTGSSQPQAASSVFGPGVIGSDPTLGEDSAYPHGPSGGFRGPADDAGQQSGVSQVDYLNCRLVNLPLPPHHLLTALNTERLVLLAVAVTCSMCSRVHVALGVDGALSCSWRSNQ